MNVDRILADDGYVVVFLRDTDFLRTKQAVESGAFGYHGDLMVASVHVHLLEKSDVVVCAVDVVILFEFFRADHCHLSTHNLSVWPYQFRWNVFCFSWPRLSVAPVIFLLLDVVVDGALLLAPRKRQRR